MSKRFAVVFSEHNAHIVKGPEIVALTGQPNVLFDPEIPPGVPPHHWKLVDGKIAVMSDEEKAARDAYHAAASPEVKPRPIAQALAVPEAPAPQRWFKNEPELPPMLSRLEIALISVSVSAATALIVTGLGFLLHAHH